MENRMKLKPLAIFIAAFALSNFALTSYAAKNFTVVNNTKDYSTARLNNGLCSSYFPGGVTAPGQTNEISETLAYIACTTQWENCQVDVYASKDCSGAQIGSLAIHLVNGVKSVAVKNPNYSIDTSTGSFKVTINQLN